jgi:hypothetical protein
MIREILSYLHEVVHLRRRYALASIGIKIIILKAMLNFSITGKKVGVSQRIPDLDPSLMIKSKVFSQKTPSAPKGKQA